MTEPRDNRVPFMMSDYELSAIDEWRFENRIPTRADALRRLCQIGLALDNQTENMKSSIEDLRTSADKLTEDVFEQNRDVSIRWVMEQVAATQKAASDLFLQMEKLLETHRVLKDGNSDEQAKMEAAKTMEIGEAERARWQKGIQLVQQGIIDAVEQDAMIDIEFKDRAATISIGQDEAS